jgi:tRNA (guanine-N7-)-methyltransferase
LTNAGFLRTNIELLPHFFAAGEVAEIWITFPDPQMKKVRKRLTSTRFLELYAQFLTPDGRINLKTDSPFLYEYTSRLVTLNHLDTKVNTADLYHDAAIQASEISDLLEIRTHYESQWLSRGLTIKYLAFLLPQGVTLQEPEADDIPLDSYRSYGRNYNTPDEE